MADYKNIPLGLRTQTQIPLDVKEYIQNESLLSNLGVNGQLAYTYTKGLVVYCIEESTRWEWIEVKPGLEDTGLINQDFIYPDNHVAFGIDYSNKRYNFVKVISGSETKINAGTNVTVTGNGTTATPYTINAIVDGSETKINSGTNVTITGSGTNATPYVVNSTNTTYTAGNGINLTGTVFSLDNLQKVITTSTVILDIDNNHTIFINNGATPITITIDSSITLPNFCVGFIQEGTGDVTFVGSGVSLTNPIGLKSKGQGYATFIERKLNTSSYFLLGNVKS